MRHLALVFVLFLPAAADAQTPASRPTDKPTKSEAQKKLASLAWIAGAWKGKKQ